ncbi:HD domain-containing protein [Candidatus Parcubacteria bacterium]|nr:HD domain-containing protein [Candidatus Parcubacteria bacterium]
MKPAAQKSLKFPLERETMLDEIYRWKVCKRFFHRSSVWLHAQRVRLMVDSLSRLAKKCWPDDRDYDAKKASVLALVHDDPEILTGDHQACHKASWSPARKLRVAKEELTAIEELAVAFPGIIAGYDYGELLRCAHRKECKESQLMKLCDKWDAFCEALHEVLAGNNIPLPMLFQDYDFLKSFLRDYPLVAPLFEQRNRHPFLKSPILRIKAPFGGKSQPHTRESVRRKTDFPGYDHWKSLILRGLGQKGMDYLINVKQEELF